MLNNKVCLVTGGASGIGEATALRFAAEGAKVVVSDISEGGEAVAARIRETGGEAVFVRCDVTKSEQIAELVERTVGEFGRLDVAFNNAGIEGALAPTGEYAEADWDRIIAVNLTSVFLSMRHEIPAMLQGGGGSIINCASVLGHVGFGGAPGYVAAKHGVIGLTKNAAQEYATSGIRVNAVCPGFIETPLVMERGVQAGKDPEAHQMLVSLHPIGRLGQSDEIAEAVVWVASDRSSFVTGTSIIADGGYTSR